MRESRESKWMGAPASPPVVVLGAGFAGLRAVRRLGRAGVATLWVDARNYHCFLPLLYQVATAGLEPQDIAYPARSILRRLRAVDFRLARVAAGDPAAQTLATASGERIAYSHLIVCTGGAASFYVPRSHPDRIDVNVRCLDGVDLATLAPEPFDGRHWEASIGTLEV